MSDTPRTDAQAYDCEYRGDMGSKFTADIGKLDPYGDHVSADFARQLERELTTAKNIIADLLNYPYPHDLMAIRYTAKQYASEELAKRFMQHYSTEDEKIKALNEWKLAQETAREFLKS